MCCDFYFHSTEIVTKYSFTKKHLPLPDRSVKVPSLTKSEFALLRVTVNNDLAPSFS